MIARVAVVLACVAVLVALTRTEHAHRDCDRARSDLYLVAYRVLPPAREDPALDTIRTRCRGTDGLIDAASVLLKQGRWAAATSFALGATRREPDSPAAWYAVAVSARTGNPALARSAAARAARLNPLQKPPAATPTKARRTTTKKTRAPRRSSRSARGPQPRA